MYKNKSGCSNDFSNELWLVKPDYKRMQKVLVQRNRMKDYEYKYEKKGPIVYLTCQKVEPKGRPPIARAAHSACFFAKNYIAIFGGRND